MKNTIHQREKHATNGYQICEGSEVSDLFVACQNNNVESVREIGSRTAYVDLNKLEPNGSTALHIASLLGHAEVVHVLLNELGILRSQQDHHGQVAYQVASTDEIRQLFHRPLGSQRFCSQTPDCDVQDTFSVVNYSENSKKENKEKRVRWIGIMEGKDDIDQMRTGVWVMKHTVKLQEFRPILLEVGRRMSGGKRYHDEQMVLETMKQVVEEKIPRSNRFYNTACALLDKYAESWNPEPLFTLYTLDTPFYSYMGRHTSGLFGLYYVLHKLKPRAYRGITYRGLSLRREKLREYEWAYLHNEEKIIFTKSFWSTSIDQELASLFSATEANSEKFSIMMIFNFPESCDTAVRLYRISENLQPISHFENESEVLITPATLFRITHLFIDESSKTCTMHLQNVTPRFELLSFIKCLSSIKRLLRHISD